MDLVVGLVQVLLISSAGFFLWLGITDGRIGPRSLRLRRPTTSRLESLAGATPTLTPRTIRQTPLG